MPFRYFARWGSPWSWAHRWMRYLSRKAPRPIFWLMLRILPARRYAVVHGWPLLEGNVVELLPSLDRRYPGPIFWLVDDEPAVASHFLSRRGLAHVKVVPKKSWTAVWLALTAEVTFFTHGLFSAVPPPSSRLVVNLWHGDGPKATTHVDFSSSVAVTGARMWRAYKAQVFGLDVTEVAWTGNPRTSAMIRGMSEEQWQRLGLDPSDTLVLWMPTFRQGRNAGGLLWSDGAPLSGRSELRGLGGAAARSGLSLLVKPHPMDQDDYSKLGIRVLTDEYLRHADVALYELLGSCSALISDTSSVWVDFLVLDRPIGFFLPDADDLANSRGFNVPDLLSILPGPVLRDVEDVEEFLESLARDRTDPGLKHAEKRERIGVTPLGDASKRLLDWLDAFQRARGRRPLFDE